jgi:DtxR family Mn-dependent transcriptional regulator
MLPSSTVENYLKVIHQQQLTLSDPDELVPMGQLASAMGVTPGTATTMVMALSESGLVLYEPYAGVKLAPAGERLAALVIRRHRLVELFLVDVMGMSWDEVHDEAEKLEHAVSERLIERMDAMLGRPRVDPHGDPIPDADGAIAHRELHTLLTCPLHVPLVVRRVTDQDAAFLRFLDANQLKPGKEIRVDARDEIADSVSVRGRNTGLLTIGARAASKLLVEAVAILAMVLGLAGRVDAQTPQAAPDPAQAAPTDSSRPFEIEDNSFLVEEAFNQGAGVVQTIFGGLFFQQSGWALTFTQEWPAPGIKHQLSVSIPVNGLKLADGERGPDGLGDIAMNYRYQLMEEGPGKPAIAPRLTVLSPTGNQGRGLGVGAWGWQMNLPVSKQHRDFYFHGNVGMTWYPRVTTGTDGVSGSAPDVTLVSPTIAGSTIYRLRPMLNLMLESYVTWQEAPTGPGRTDRLTVGVVSPGLRGGWNRGEAQIILGAALPVTWADGATHLGLFTYFSYETRFWKVRTP